MFTNFVKNLIKAEDFGGIAARAAVMGTKIDSEQRIVDALSIIKGGEITRDTLYAGRVVVDIHREDIFLTWIPVPQLQNFLIEHIDKNPDATDCDYDIIQVSFRDYTGTNIPCFTTLANLFKAFYKNKEDFDVHVLINPAVCAINAEIEGDTPEDMTEQELYSMAVSQLMDDIRIDKEDGLINYNGKSMVHLTTEFSEIENIITKFDIDYNKVTFGAPEDAVVVVNYDSTPFVNTQFFTTYRDLLALAIMYKAKVEGLVTQEDCDRDIANYNANKEKQDNNKCKQ